jgi:hypothetical protein
MQTHRWCLVLMAAALGCGPVVSVPVEPGPTAAPRPSPALADAGDAMAPDAEAAAADGAATDAGEAAPRAGGPLRRTADWPFAAWDRAEGIAFNQFPARAGVPLRVYTAEKGWSPHIASRKPLDAEQARNAAAWVIRVGGEYQDSKCPFPRHAVVFYAGEVPVGSVNVCFECGDIMVWPAYDSLPGSRRKIPEAQKRHWFYAQKETAYARVLPLWKRLFRDELGFSITPPRPHGEGSRP